LANRQKDAIEILDGILPSILPQISAVPAGERAAALAVANAMLLAGAEKWGRNLSHSPMKLSPAAASEAVTSLAAHHRSIENAISEAGIRPADDPYPAACRWELIATKLVMVTAGARMGRSYAEAAGAAWRKISSARRAAEDGVRLLQEYAQAYSVSPVPLFGNRKPDRQLLLSLASSLPPMFRSKRPRK